MHAPLYNPEIGGRKSGLLLLIFALLVTFLPNFCIPREVQKYESLYAAAAREYKAGDLTATIHEEATIRITPLLPAIISGLAKYNISAERTLRGITLLSVIFGAALCFAVAKKERNQASGFCAAAIYLSTILIIDKSSDHPGAMLSAMLLLAAQLAMREYGVGKYEWNKTWLVCGALLMLACSVAGIMPLLFFIFPLIFMRRPLSAKIKYKKAGFIIAAGIFLLLALFFITVALRKTNLSSEWQQLVSERKYFVELLTYPWVSIFRLLPWTVILWIPFCPALQGIDPTPMTSRYFRTLIICSALLLWLMPDHSPWLLFYLLGPLSILSGIYYDMAMSRYHRKYEYVFQAAPWVIMLGVIIILAAGWLPEGITKQILSKNAILLLIQRQKPFFRIFCFSGALLCSCLATLAFLSRNRASLWQTLLLIVCGGSIVYSTVILPCKSQNHEKKLLAEEILKAMENKRTAKLYTYTVRNLHGVLYYTKLPVKAINSADQLPDNDDVYMISSASHPQLRGHRWVALKTMKYNGNIIKLWCGYSLKQEKKP